MNRYLATIKTLLRHHQQPWEHIKLKKESKGRIRVLTKDEEVTVVALLPKGTWLPLDLCT